MVTTAGQATIDRLLEEFLAEQRERLAERTYRTYAEVIALLRHSLDGYAYQSLNGGERRRFEEAFDAGDEQAFCRLFGPEKLPEHLGSSLNSFMVSKVMAGQELLRAAGTVCGKLMRWLQARGYLAARQADAAVERAREAARELPAAERLGELLYDVAEDAEDLGPDTLADDDWVEDQLEITAVQPGRIWFEGDVGPVAVPEEASRLARVGQQVFITAARTDGHWRLLEVGVVYP